MKKIPLLIFVFIALAALSFSQNTTELIEEQTGKVSLELVQSWQLLAVAALMISTILVAIAYAIGKGLEMPELQAWAGTELRQVFSNAVLIVFLFVAIGFIDTLSMLIINDAAPGGLHCDIGDNCLKTVSIAYLDDYISAAEISIKDTVKNNMKASAWAGRSVGIYGTSIKVGQISLTFPLAAYKVLDVDRYSIVFGYYTGVLSSLYSQKFFIEQFAFKVGPVILALGIVGRSFFITRKTGGLLIAIAAGVMFFFPAMYFFDWATLDMMIEGDNAIVGDQSLCPPECIIASPLAYYTVGGEGVLLEDPNDVYDVFGTDEAEKNKAKKLVNGTLESAINASGIEVFSCDYDENPSDGVGCPRACRELPYPNSVPACADPANQTACAKLDKRCKVIRYVPGGTEAPEYEECPKECKIIPPLKSDCSGFGKCLESRLDCRVAKKSEAYDDPPFQWRPSVDERVEGSERCNKFASDCPASLNAEESCVWVMPETGSCDNLCVGCPSYCRIKGGDESNFASGCFDSETGGLLGACDKCPDTCKLDIDDIKALDPQPPNCTACPAEKRILGAHLPEELTSEGCSKDECPADYKLYPPRSACEECILTPESYQYDPPINMECGDLCKPKNKVPMSSPGDYMKINEEGLVGMSEIKNVSKMMIPAYLLPLFNIVVTLVFIKTLSGMIGGDIEIPGISKLF